MTPLASRLSCRLAVIFSLCGLARGAAMADSDWSLRVWKSDDGLPNNHVTGLAQTTDGYLWVATFSRPARFDGVQFDKYFLRDFNLPANQKITSLLRGRQGLWLGTSHGFVLSLDTTTVRLFTNGLPDKVIQAFVEDHDGALWMTYQNGMVCRLKDGQVTSFTTRDGLPPSDLRDQSACSLACDVHGRIWFAKNGRLGIFGDGRFQTLLPLPATTAKLAAARDGGVWIGSGGELMRFDDGKSLEKFGAFGDADIDSTVLLEDHDRGVWIGTENGGLFHFDGARIEKVPVSGRWITSIVEDHEGNVWAGTESGGLNRLRPRTIRLETAETGLPEGTIQSLCQAMDGTIWAATQNGLLLHRTNGAWETVSTNAGWPGGRATCVAQDRGGRIWVGTKDRTLYCRQDDRFVSWSRTEGMVAREIHALLPDKHGDLWIGAESPDVVQRLHDGKWETFPMPAETRIIRAMTEDAAGRVWLGSSGGRLVCIADGVVTDKTPPTTGTPLSIRCVRATDDGSIWVGYADEGIGWLKEGRFVHLTAQQNFPEDNVSQIIADGAGWLWFGGDHGIFKVRQQELERFASGQWPEPNYVRYGQSEGLFSLEANCGDSPGAVRTADDRLWIPMRTALAIVDPAREREDPQPPPVLLKRVTVDDQAAASYGGDVPVRNGLGLPPVGAGLRLPAGYHRLKFEFTALSFSAPENVRFRYRLEGVDDRWIDSGTERTASYSRLGAGKYRFRVAACNRSGIWNEDAAIFGFSVAPFFWQTWWFRFTVPSLFTVAVVAFVRYISFRRLRSRLLRLEQQAALEKERARIARDIHDDLGGRLTEVELMLDGMNRVPPDKLNGQVRRIFATVQQAGESLDEIVWAVNPCHDTLPQLLDYVGQYAIQFLQTAGIRCRVDFPDDPPPLVVPPDLRHNLFLTIKEALNNIVRHAGAAEVWLRVSLAERHLEIVVEDNGKGFAGTTSDPGADGLRNMRRRMEEVGGQFDLDTAPGAGTRIRLTLPLPAEKNAVSLSH